MTKFVSIKQAAVLTAFLILACCGSNEPAPDGAANGSALTKAGDATSRPDAAVRPTAFGQCATCHTDQAGKNGLGPSLFGVVGRKAASVPGFNYSSAMQESNLRWDEATLDRFIAAPRDLVPKTKMSFAGLRDADKRAQIITYLATLK